MNNNELTQGIGNSSFSAAPSLFSIFLPNASASPLGGVIILVLGFGQADYGAKPATRNKSSNP